LVNPAQVKALNGRKSDGRDAQRIAEYLQDGRLDASFVPPPEVRQLRMLLRHGVSLLEQRNEVHNQIRDLFETAEVASFEERIAEDDSLSRTDRVAGDDGHLRKKEKLVKESLKECFNEFHKMILGSLRARSPGSSVWWRGA
jgi:transposase